MKVRNFEANERNTLDCVTETNTYRAFLPFNTPIRIRETWVRVPLRAKTNFSDGCVELVKIQLQTTNFIEN